jgi:hypothetical protein
VTTDPSTRDAAPKRRAPRSSTSLPGAISECRTRPRGAPRSRPCSASAP